MRLSQNAMFRRNIQLSETDWSAYTSLFSRVAAFSGSGEVRQFNLSTELSENSADHYV
jgi:hypothetical protein